LGLLSLDLLPRVAAKRDFIANDEEACLGNFIKLSVDPTAKSYTVTIPAKQISRTYRVR
jgi:hypothetical protein